MINYEAIKAIYKFEMARTFRTIIQSIISPILSTILYFIVFGTAIGKNINFMSDIPYGAFIVPGLILLTVSMQSVTNASFGIFFPKFLGTTYELLSAPISYVEILIGFVGAATTKSFFLGVIIYITSTFFVEIKLEYPFLMLLMLLLSCISFSLLGFIIGISSDNFEQINLTEPSEILPYEPSIKKRLKRREEHLYNVPTEHYTNSYFQEIVTQFDHFYSYQNPWKVFYRKK